MIYKMDKPLAKHNPFTKNGMTEQVRMQAIALWLFVRDSLEYKPNSLEIPIYIIFSKGSN